MTPMSIGKVAGNGDQLVKEWSVHYRYNRGVSRKGEKSYNFAFKGLGLLVVFSLKKIGSNFKNLLDSY